MPIENLCVALKALSTDVRRMFIRTRFGFIITTPMEKGITGLFLAGTV
jgi:hypothetical protein